jgi:hypothetical protein
MPSNQAQQNMTLSYHLPIAIAEQFRYSVDVNLTYRVCNGCNPREINIEAFNPNNPSIVFRNGELQFYDDVDGSKVYLDVIWALNADSPETADAYVLEHLSAIPVPQGFVLKQVTTNGEVYDNQEGRWY